MYRRFSKQETLGLHDGGSTSLWSPCRPGGQDLKHPFCTWKCSYICPGAGLST